MHVPRPTVLHTYPTPHLITNSSNHTTPHHTTPHHQLIKSHHITPHHHTTPSHHIYHTIPKSHHIYHTIHPNHTTPTPPHTPHHISSHTTYLLWPTLVLVRTAHHPQLSVCANETPQNVTHEEGKLCCANHLQGIAQVWGLADHLD